ncbi:MAG: secretin N-terminal domain-containing protein [Gemmatimonadaceae bacterium]
MTRRVRVYLNRGALAAVLLVTSARFAGAQPAAQSAGLRLDFQNAALGDVIRAVAQSLGMNVALGDIPDKRISFSTAGPVAARELSGVLETLLETNGLVLVQQGSVAQVYPTEKAPATGQVRFGMDFPDPAPVGIVSQLVPLTSIGADEGAAALTRIAGPAARIEPVARSNSLLITDRGANVARYLQLLRKLDETPAGESGLRTYVVPLKYANAEDLAQSLAQLFGIVTTGSRSRNLDDQSLSRTLDTFRQRESDSYRQRSELMNTRAGASAVPATTDTVGARARPGVLVGQTTVVPHAPSNAILIRTSPPNFPLLQETIQALDIRPSQVLFEVTVAEIALGKGDQWGIDWHEVGGSVESTFGDPFTGDSSRASTLVTRLISLRNANVRAVLATISTTSNVRVLSTPELLATNNREARVLVGSRVPFISSQRLGNDIAVDRAVQYENVGTQLTIIPTINQDDYVSVQILQEVSTLTRQTVAAAFDAPVISTREASTRAVIRHGQTVVIAGLIGDNREETESGIPFLRDIPLLGYLFKNKSITNNRTELAIFVTPYLVRNDADADLLRERIRDRMNGKTPGAVPDSLVRKKPGDGGSR